MTGGGKGLMLRIEARKTEARRVELEAGNWKLT